MENKYEAVKLKEIDLRKRKYLQCMIVINIVAYVICWNLAFISYYISNIALLLILLTSVYLTLLIAAILKYRVDKTYRKVDASMKEYLKIEVLSYIFFTLFALTLFIGSYIRSEEILLFVFVNLLIFVAILIAIFNPMVKILKRNTQKINDVAFERNVKKLAKNMGIGDVKIGILPWKKLKIANALQIGTKEVYVFISDYLFENLTLQENLAVLAHEFAHIKLKHIFKIQIFVFSVILGIAYFYFLPPLFLGDGSTTLLIQVIGIWSGIILLSIFLPIIRRRFETQADLFAAKYVQPEYLISALNKLTDLNFMPKNISKVWGLDHPSISKRINNIEESIK